MTSLTTFELIPLWGKVLLTIVLVLLSITLGARLGTARRRQLGPEREEAIGPAVGGALGLLAFMLAFTFGLAANRYDTRKALILEEANAIQTLYLRAGLLPEPHGGKIRSVVREYVDLRAAFAAGRVPVTEAMTRSRQMQERIWTQVATLAAADPPSTVLPLVIETANQVIDLHTKRVTVGMHYRIPPPIWVPLFLVSALSMAALGYHFGVAGGRVGRPLILIVTLAFTTVIYLVADLDSAGEGAIRGVDQQPILDLQEHLKAAQSQGTR
jgi:hypothetical protein